MKNLNQTLLLVKWNNELHTINAADITIAEMNNLASKFADLQIIKFIHC